MKTYFLCLFLYFFNTFTGYSQDPGLQILQTTSIQHLKGGTLLVRLESKEKKLNYLRQSLLNPDCDARCRSKKEEEIQEIDQSAKRFNQTFIQAFRKHFNFCDLLFYYDKDHHALKSAGWVGNYFLTDQLSNQTARPLNPDSCYILYKDLTPESQAEGWLVQTPDGQFLGKGFPFIIENNAKTLMNYFASSDHLTKNCNYMVRKFNKQLYKFHSQAEIKKIKALEVKD